MKKFILLFCFLPLVSYAAKVRIINVNHVEVNGDVKGCYADVYANCPELREELEFKLDAYLQGRIEANPVAADREVQVLEYQRSITKICKEAKKSTKDLARKKADEERNKIKQEDLKAEQTREARKHGTPF